MISIDCLCIRLQDGTPEQAKAIVDALATALARAPVRHNARIGSVTLPPLTVPDGQGVGTTAAASVDGIMNAVEKVSAR